MYIYEAEIENIVDGDTVDVKLDLGFKLYHRVRLRLYGINAPERYTEDGKAAIAWLSEKIPVGTRVVVKTYKDKTEKYGRYLATIVYDGEDLNKSLVDTGHAEEYMI